MLLNLILPLVLAWASEAGPLRADGDPHAKWPRLFTVNSSSLASPLTTVTFVPSDISSAFLTSTSPGSPSDTTTDIAATTSTSERPGFHDPTLLSPTTKPVRSTSAAAAKSLSASSTPNRTLSNSTSNNSSSSVAPSSTRFAATGIANTNVPTAITALSSGSAVPSAVYAANLDRARTLNALYANLGESSACTAGQAACIRGSVARCRADGSYGLVSCPRGTSCFALPMRDAEGAGLGCVDKAKAQSILGGSNTTTLPTTAGNCTDPGYDSTTTVTRDSSVVTVTQTVTATSAETGSTTTSPPLSSSLVLTPTPTSTATQTAPSSQKSSMSSSESFKSFASNDIEPTFLPSTTDPALIPHTVVITLGTTATRSFTIPPADF